MSMPRSHKKNKQAEDRTVPTTVSQSENLCHLHKERISKSVDHNIHSILYDGVTYYD